MDAEVESVRPSVLGKLPNRSRLGLRGAPLVMLFCLRKGPATRRTPTEGEWLENRFQPRERIRVFRGLSHHRPETGAITSGAGAVLGPPGGGLDWRAVRGVSLTLGAEGGYIE